MAPPTSPTPTSPTDRPGRPSERTRTAASPTAPPPGPGGDSGGWAPPRGADAAGARRAPAAGRTGTGPGGASHGEDASRPWRDRLPEVVGAFGTVLVLASVAGFLNSTWEALDAVGQGLVLAGAAAGATAVAVQAEQWLRDQLSTLVSMLWLVGTALAGAATLLLLAGALDPPSRLTALVAGLAAAAHGVVALRRSPDSALRQLGVVGGLLLAAGPFGTAWTDRADAGTLLDLLTPIGGLFDPTLVDSAHTITGPAHLLVGLGWMLLALRRTGRAARTAEVGATVLLGYAALELLVVPSPLGPFVALLVVAALLAHGLVTEHAARVLSGAALVVVCGGRVVWSLFSGEVAVTVAALLVGLGLLTWAIRSRESADEVAAREGAQVGAPGATPDADAVPTQPHAASR